MHDDKNVELFCEDLIDIALKTSQSIRKLKKHDLILKIAISNIKNSFLFITFPNTHLMVGISQV